MVFAAKSNDNACAGSLQTVFVALRAGNTVKFGIHPACMTSGGRHPIAGTHRVHSTRPKMTNWFLLRNQMTTLALAVYRQSSLPCGPETPLNSESSPHV